jgi:acyl carrier protein
VDKQNETTAAILRIVRNVMDRPALAADDDVFDHGATSLAFIRVLAVIHQEYGVVIRPAELDPASVRSLAAQVTAAGGTGSDRPLAPSMGA